MTLLNMMLTTHIPSILSNKVGS